MQKKKFLSREEKKQNSVKTMTEEEENKVTKNTVRDGQRNHVTKFRLKNEFRISCRNGKKM